MATAAKSTAKSKTASRAAPRRTRRTGRRDPLAISLLKQDHREVETWFDEYEQLESDKERLALFSKIALALKVHTRIEEEIFYPAERGEVEDDLLDEAYVEHDSAKKLIAESGAQWLISAITSAGRHPWVSTPGRPSKKGSLSRTM